ncbi:MAG: cysteine synthase A [Maricaulis sp.]|jgi:cysteine synthase A
MNPPAIIGPTSPAQTIVTVFHVYSSRYHTMLYNPVFMHEKGLPVPAWLYT